MSTIHATYQLNPSTSIEIAQGDLTQEPLDAIVNAANRSLSHGGGIAGAIVHAGGIEIQRESDEWVRQHGQVSHAVPAYTNAGKLPARYVIHAVGPVWGAGDEDFKLASAIRGSLRRAEELELASIAFPAISTGIFRFPKDRAARIFFETFKAHFTANPDSTLRQVRVTLWEDDSLEIFLAAARQVLGNPQ